MRRLFTNAAKKIAVVFTISILSSCKPVAVKQGQPEWLLNPGDGVVASCGFHIKGHYAQQECAVQHLLFDPQILGALQDKLEQQENHVLKET